MPYTGEKLLAEKGGALRSVFSKGGHSDATARDSQKLLSHRSWSAKRTAAYRELAAYIGPTEKWSEHLLSARTRPISETFNEKGLSKEGRSCAMTRRLNPMLKKMFSRSALGAQDVAHALKCCWVQTLPSVCRRWSQSGQVCEHATIPQLSFIWINTMALLGSTRHMTGRASIRWMWFRHCYLQRLKSSQFDRHAWASVRRYL